MAVRSREGRQAFEEYDPEEVVYIQNERGGVHSVTRRHYDLYLTQTSPDTGKTYPLPGWKVVSEEEARKSNPQLFGSADPRIRYTAKELTEQYQQKQMYDALYSQDPEHAAVAPPPQ